jgi:glucuronyl/N-acetylglucosaminyl transferase EXT1
MADSWVLPFEEILDWGSASLNFDERDYIVSPMVLRHVGDKRVFELRQQGVFFYHAYFSSLERIILTSLEIIRERVHPQHKKPSWVWNHGEGISGALATFSSKSVNYDLDYPFYNSDLDFENVKPVKTRFTENTIESEKFVQSDQRYSAVVQVVAPQVKALTKVLVALDKSKSCGQVLVIWNMKTLPVKVRKRLESFKKVEIIPAFEKFEQFDDISSKFGEYVSRRIRFNGVLSLDDDVKLISDEMEYAFEVWRMEKDRIVGFPNRLHYWLQGSMSDADGRIQKITRWAYTSKFHNEYSLVLSGAAFLHKFYLNNYTNSTNIGGHSISRSVVNKYKNCEDILINFVVADLTGKPPIKITQRKRYKNTEAGQNENEANMYGLDLTAENAPLAPRWTEKAHFQERQICMNKFFEDFGYMPLMTSQLRLDPTLYKDNVAAWRKQYKSIEIVGDE